jgi:hypothetical protein
VLGISSSNLHLRIRDQGTAHRAACELIEQIRVAGPANAYAQYTAVPTVTVQGLQATVTFPEDASTGNFGGGMTNQAAIAAGFLPVSIRIDQGGQRYVFTTFVGAR